ncbi:hypothetical protein DFH09DRAFT_1481074 [Mycena vulgaris]|nr:hypothetical protein DFH09DRAFT_1481074 [Mycena vulgaris]
MTPIHIGQRRRSPLTTTDSKDSLPDSVSDCTHPPRPVRTKFQKYARSFVLVVRARLTCILLPFRFGLALLELFRSHALDPIVGGSTFIANLFLSLTHLIAFYHYVDFSLVFGGMLNPTLTFLFRCVCIMLAARRLRISQREWDMRKDEPLASDLEPPTSRAAPHPAYGHILVGTIVALFVGAASEHLHPETRIVTDLPLGSTNMALAWVAAPLLVVCYIGLERIGRKAPGEIGGARSAGEVGEINVCMWVER